ncbi:MAG: hypothetical protein WD397_04125 [Wenzhouxiangellaceae bacterium]
MNRISYLFLASFFLQTGCSTVMSQNPDVNESGAAQSGQFPGITKLTVKTDDPEGLIEYSWKVLHSLDPGNNPCGDEKCLGNNDVFNLVQLNPGAALCDAEILFVMHDESNSEIKTFRAINPEIGNCTAAPKWISFHFWDVDKNKLICRNMKITGLRVKGSPDETKCWSDLEDISGIPHQQGKFSNACDQTNLVHWEVENPDNITPCGSASGPVILAPPEPGQGTASGTQ